MRRWVAAEECDACGHVTEPGHWVRYTWAEWRRDRGARHRRDRRRRGLEPTDAYQQLSDTLANYWEAYSASPPDGILGHYLRERNAPQRRTTVRRS